MYPIKLSGRVVNLREFAPDDAAAVFSIIGDDRVTHWLSFDSRTEDQAHATIAGAIERGQEDPRTEFYLAVTAGETLVGFARLAISGTHVGKLGYAIAADHWGHGYASDAAATLVDFGFHQLGLHRISAAIGPENTASIRVAERLGMTLEGRIRDHVFTNGAWRDSLLYSVLEHEWAARPALT
jgi:RimJ/RimL family protein N-acetyltransferase